MQVDRIAVHNEDRSSVPHQVHVQGADQDGQLAIGSQVSGGIII